MVAMESLSGTLFALTNPARMKKVSVNELEACAPGLPETMLPITAMGKQSALMTSSSKTPSTTISAGVAQVQVAENALARSVRQTQEYVGVLTGGKHREAQTPASGTTKSVPP